MYLLFVKETVWVLKSKKFDKKSIALKWNYVPMWIHPLTVCQKNKVVKNKGQDYDDKTAANLFNWGWWRVDPGRELEGLVELEGER